MDNTHSDKEFYSVLVTPNESPYSPIPTTL